ncbi:MAG TPA: DUF397 domain-containing protein [Rugosimonospora sp.]|nr:DUF397 domain-containing protein [Rugosimonospora sp.]
MTDSPPRRYTKSSRSGGSGGNCVEWAFAGVRVHIRDSKDPDGPQLVVTAAEWASLTAAAATGCPHPWIRHHPGGTDLVAAGCRLRFTPAEWVAFADAARAGECARVPAPV